MLAFFTDLANVAFIVGVMFIYFGLSMYKWDKQEWKILAAPMAIAGVFGVSYSISIYIDTVMGVLAGLLFGGIVCFALFMVGHENQ